MRVSESRDCLQAMPSGSILEQAKLGQLRIMKIAIPTREGRVDDHFGHCDHYTIFTIEEGAIVATSTLPAPQGCGCKSGIAGVLAEMGVEVMLAGNMGQGAKTSWSATE